MAEIELGDIPPSFVETVIRHLANFSMGFVRDYETPDGTDAALLGSGTLIQVGSTRAILTARHVLEVLPRSGQLGLILSTIAEFTTVEVDELHYLEIGRGPDERDGPDIGAVILSQDIGSALAARKSFIYLERQRERILNEPPALDYGLWFVHGYLDERTREFKDMEGFHRVKVFQCFSAGGRVDEARRIGRYDYFTFPLSYGEGSVAPEDFRGTSGGGLWQVLVGEKPDGTPEPREYLLSGVAFYQEPIQADQSAVRCHGRRSVYDVAYKAIQQGGI